MRFQYELPDGNVIGGNTYAEVVRAMASMKLGEVHSQDGYRRETARRSMEMYQAKIDPTTDETFVKTMVEEQLLVVVP